MEEEEEEEEEEVGGCHHRLGRCLISFCLLSHESERVRRGKGKRKGECMIM